MKHFYIKTLGCKVNQVESAYIAERLEASGLVPAKNEDSAEILILNSCAVTERACTEAKKIIGTWAKLGAKKIILTGCAGQVFPEKYENLAEKLNIKNFLILGQNEKFELERYLTTQDESPKKIISSVSDTCFPLILRKFLNHSRAFVKIQDGCSSFCSYCIVPYARGKSRSLPEEHILNQVRIFIEQGYEEIVITGIHIGLWGEDFEKKRKLVDLLIKIEDLISNYKREFNIRLSSLEVNEIDEEFIDYAKTSRFLCPHFHIPLQSGSNTILEKMNRKYLAEEYLEKIARLYELFPEATFGADVIVGFPGEGEREFRETYELIEKSPINWLHVFPYSDRPGTPSEKLEPKVGPEIKRERVHLLRELHRKKRENFLRGQMGSVRKTILEEERETHVKGLTDNYIQVLIPKSCLSYFLRGKLIRQKLIRVEDLTVLAVPYGDCNSSDNNLPDCEKNLN